MNPSIRRLAVACGALLVFAQAGGQTVAVSNLGQNYANTGWAIGTFSPWVYKVAFGFTTGSTNVSLSNFVIFLNGTDGAATGLSFSLYSGISSAGPTGAVADLSGPSVISNGANYTYSPTAPTTLLANTTYWIAGTAPDTANNTAFSIAGTSSFAEDSGALPGWSIVDGCWLSNNVAGGTTWNFQNTSVIPQFSVALSAIPEPEAGTAFLATGVLGHCALRRRHGAGRQS